MSDAQKTVAVMQPYFFPYIGYFQLINIADVFVFYDDVNYINRGWVNRNNILLNGESHLITLPLQGASQNRKINEIGIADQQKVCAKLLKTISSAYSRAPFYKDVFPFLSEWMLKSYSGISEFNRETVTEICRYIGVRTRLVGTSAVYSNSALKGQERILDICKQEGADRYVNPSGGTELYSASLFVNAGIDLKFLKAEPKSYNQGTSGFVPYLSIIDYLMFVRRDELMGRLQEYSLFGNTNNP